MMASSYDEDLSENTFYKTLQTKYGYLYHKATSNRWTLCIPRVTTLTKVQLSEEFFKSHILIPGLEVSHQFKTVNDKELLIENNALSTGPGFESKRTVPIMFEETFFNEKDESFRVLCIFQPLEGGPDVFRDTDPGIVLQNLDDCKELLWGHTGNHRVQKTLDSMIAGFNRELQGKEIDSIRNLVNHTSSLFDDAMRTVLKDGHLRRLTRHNKVYMDSVKVAAETYISHGIYCNIFKIITTCMSRKDSNLNKITRNLSQLQLRDLGVRQEFSQNVPNARRALSSLNRYSTPLGKLNCVKRVVQLLLQPRKKGKIEEEPVALTTDDLLPILVFMVVKSEIPNWWANFSYMTTFRFSKTNSDDELGYYIASLEAALEHVNSGAMQSVEIGVENPQRITIPSNPDGGSIWQRQDSDSQLLVRLFEAVKDNEIGKVNEILNMGQQSEEEFQRRLCHPLCKCSKCVVLIAEFQHDMTVTVFSRDDRGATVAHVAAKFGHTDMLEYLIVEKGSKVNTADYHGYTPLHVACQKGQQKVTLLLLHHKASVNVQDNDGNTPLHLATANGHQECVKALVFFDQGSTLLNMDFGNDQGDTALHLAAKWGYDQIIRILLENGARVDFRNKRDKTPFACAHNLRVANMLTKAGTEQSHVAGFIVLKPRQRIQKSNSLSVLPGLPRSFKQNPKLASKQKTPSVTALDKKIDKLLKACADGDLEMGLVVRLFYDVSRFQYDDAQTKVRYSTAPPQLIEVKYILGWGNGSDDEELDLSDKQLCHPLCQCEKCQPIQKFTSGPVNGFHVNSSNQDGVTPLHTAARHGHCHLVELFIKRGANVDYKTEKGGHTALHFACQHSKTKVVEMLLSHEATINVTDKKGNSPLHLCCATTQGVEMARMLLEKNANPNQTNSLGNTPLHEAARWNYYKLVKTLLYHGANVDRRSKHGILAVQLAKKRRVINILERTARLGHYDEDVCDGLDPSLVDPDGEVFDLGQSGFVDVKELFANFDGKDRSQLEDLARSVKTFDRRHSLRHSVTFDRSDPLYNLQTRHLWRIQHFDSGKLHHVDKFQRSSSVNFEEDFFKNNLLQKSLSMEEITERQEAGDSESLVVGNRIENNMKENNDLVKKQMYKDSVSKNSLQTDVQKRDKNTQINEMGGWKERDEIENLIQDGGELKNKYEGEGQRLFSNKTDHNVSTSSEDTLDSENLRGITEEIMSKSQCNQHAKNKDIFEGSCQPVIKPKTAEYGTNVLKIYPMTDSYDTKIKQNHTNDVEEELTNQENDLDIDPEWSHFYDQTYFVDASKLKDSLKNGPQSK